MRIHDLRLPFIFASVDVEAAHGKAPFDQMILGHCDNGQRHGTFEIAKALEDVGATGTFFVDVYEDVLWGDVRMKSLCQDLVARGHDVQLHTHPSWRSDPRDSAELNAFKAARTRFPPDKDFMAKLSRAEQVAFIAEGRIMLENWLDRPVLAHRSGGYSINDDTIAALRANNIMVDSSMNGSHVNSKITWSNNRVIERDGLLELPVTYYRLLAAKQIPGLFSRLMKTDLDSTPLWILKDLTRRFEVQKLGVLHLFMHSFTLLNMAPDFQSIMPHNVRIKRLRAYLSFAVQNGWTVGGIERLMQIGGWQEAIQQGTDKVFDYSDPSLLVNLVNLRLKREVLLRGKRLRVPSRMIT